MAEAANLTDHFKAVFISPHLDDAVFACGGTIARLAANNPVLVVNVFTGYPTDFSKGAIKVGQERYMEEREAAQFLGYQSLNLGETDAIFRPATGGSPGRLFRPLRATDIARIAPLGRRIDTLLAELYYEQLYVPMAIGWHVDHLLCHLATRHHLSERGVFLYEDAPYCLIPNATRYRAHEVGRPTLEAPSRKSLLGDWRATSSAYLSTTPVAGIRPLPLRLAANVVVAAFLGRLLWEHLPPSAIDGKPELRPVLTDISDTFERKIAACYLYESQVNEFFSDRSDCIARYTRYAEILGGAGQQYERFWTCAAPT